MTVPTPTVKAMVGTLERSPSKNLALASMVSMAKVFTRVLDTRLDPGSLKAMWPSGPIPGTGTAEQSQLWEQSQQLSQDSPGILQFPAIPLLQLRFVSGRSNSKSALRSHQTIP